MEKYYEPEMELMTHMPLQKAYEDLTLKDDFIFGKVMQDKELCIHMLSLLTGNEIDNIVSISNQKPVKITGDSKGVRYDVYVEDLTRSLRAAMSYSYVPLTLLRVICAVTHLKTHALKKQGFPLRTEEPYCSSTQREK